MTKLKNIDQKGFIYWHGIMAIFVVAAIGFAGGSVYTSQQEAKKSTNAAVNEETDVSELTTIENKAEVKQEPVEIPAEKPKADPVPEPAPAPKPVPAPVKKTPAPAPVKKEPNYVGISASSQVGADAVILTASLPASYSGTCKALVKHMDGSNFRWLETSFTSSTSCSITVPRNTITTASEWQYYLYFNSSDWTAKGDSGRHTFTL